MGEVPLPASLLACLFLMQGLAMLVVLAHVPSRCAILTPQSCERRGAPVPAHWAFSTVPTQ